MNAPAVYAQVTAAGVPTANSRGIGAAQWAPPGAGRRDLAPALPGWDAGARRDVPARDRPVRRRPVLRRVWF